MDVVTKSVDAAVHSIESEHPNGEFEVILSTETLDRDDENLWADEWKQPLPARIHIDGDHGRTLEKTVGSAVPCIEGNRMIGKGTYAGTEYAQMVRQLVNEGHINSVSVTYAERKNQKDNSIQRELLNAAFVAIPANPEAVVLASKSYNAATRNKALAAGLSKYFGEEIAVKIADATLTPEEAREFFSDKAEGGLSASGDNPKVSHDGMVQAIHDAAYQLGAECQNAAEADPGTDEGGNKSVGTIYVDVVPRVKSANVLDDNTFHNVKDLPPETSSVKAGTPQESADESTAAAQKAAAADESADPTAEKERLALRARSLTFLTKQTAFKENHAQ